MSESTISEVQPSHDLAAGVVVVRERSVLAVYEHGYWTLPKGGCETGEFFRETAIREAKEETDLDVEIQGIAFTSEVRIADDVQHFQRYYEATASGEPTSNDPENEVEDVAFIPIDDIAQSITYRPLIVPLLEWLAEGEPIYRRFDLRTESSDLGGD